MYRHAIRHLVVLILVAFTVNSCFEQKATEPSKSGSFPGGAIYVRPGGTGIGTSDQPMGSLHLALEKAYQNPSVRQINVAVGELNESVRVRSGVHITGGLDPNAGWTSSPTQKTTLKGRRIDNLYIAMVIRNISRPVIVENMTIIGESAIDSSYSSYGIYIQDAPDVSLLSCQVSAGNGQVGRSGDAGMPGATGANANKQAAGLSPVGGGEGGSGGPANSASIMSGREGNQGFCFDGSVSGGIAGQGSTFGNGLPGQIGNGGEVGTAGAGATDSPILEPLDPYLLIKTSSGLSGTNGANACGGGGGGGSSSLWTTTYSYDGWSGGGGGAGGEGGHGGRGGTGGGASISLFCSRSKVSLSNCLIVSGDGGRGGRGGLGGQGGSGGKGGVVTSYFYNGGLGGDGGKGGNGG
ncbi:MAG: hypothetical protein SGI97_02480, partial [candidate division Zixibacteria bacterium]|nr:hypothetical protein [candidate division Zixibacteria bacterium]